MLTRLRAIALGALLFGVGSAAIAVLLSILAWLGGGPSMVISAPTWILSLGLAGVVAFLAGRLTGAATGVDSRLTDALIMVTLSVLFLSLLSTVLPTQTSIDSSLDRGWVGVVLLVTPFAAALAGARSAQRTSRSREELPAARDPSLPALLFAVGVGAVTLGWQQGVVRGTLAAVAIAVCALLFGRRG